MTYFFFIALTPAPASQLGAALFVSSDSNQPNRHRNDDFPLLEVFGPFARLLE
jgi:hypothetical protein